MLTDRCWEILRMLANDTRLLTADQLARTWWRESTHARQNAMTRMRQLKHAGLVQIRTVLVHPEIMLEAPLATWSPGDDPPEFGAVSWQAQKRWRAPPIRTPIVTATDKAKHIVGAPLGRRALRTRELVHDIHVAQVFLTHYYTHKTTQWTAEDQLRAQGWTHDFVPDALVSGINQTVAIDFVGSYPAAKIQAMHSSYAKVHIPYQLW